MRAPTEVIVLRGEDPTGNGWFGASRSGGRKHQGTDYCAKPGEKIFACESGKVRIGYPYRTSKKMKLVEITNDKYQIKQMYVAPIVNNGQMVTEGEIIGYAQDVANYHNSPKMKNHVHIEIRKNGVLINPETVIK